LSRVLLCFIFSQYGSPEDECFSLPLGSKPQGEGASEIQSSFFLVLTSRSLSRGLFRCSFPKWRRGNAFPGNVLPCLPMTSPSAEKPSFFSPGSPSLLFCDSLRLKRLRGQLSRRPLPRLTWLNLFLGFSSLMS